MSTRHNLHLRSSRHPAAAGVIARAVLLAGLLLSLAGFTPTPPPPGGDVSARITQVDTAQFPRVTAYVSVTDAAGEPVAVSPSQLKLLENGRPIAADDISGAGDIGPLATILVIDTSGSMNSGGKLQAAKSAARSYIEDAREDDLIGILSFNTEVQYVQPLTKDRAALLEAISALRARNDTAMYDALAQAMELVGAVEGRRAIIVMTDGLDNRSVLSSPELVQTLSAAGLTVSTIGLGDPTHSQGAVTSLDETGLKALATEAGGQYGYASDAESLQGLYERFGRALQSEYVITYTSPSSLRDGVNRALSVELASGAGSSAASPISYNPGGLVPEVAEPASWTLFAALVIGLLLLLFAPLLIGRFSRSSGNADNHEKAPGRVKLEAAPPAPKKTRSSGNVKLKG